MAEPKAAWGIDIGQAGLKALKVRYIESANQVVAEAFDYIPFPKILSQPDAIPEEIVPEAMQTFLSRNDLTGDHVGISVPGQSALARFIQLPPVEAGKLHEIVKYEARQQIPFALEDVIWDYQPLGAGAEEGGFLLDAEVGLFAMKRDQVYQHMRPFTNNKVELDLIQIAPLALYNFVSVDEMGIRSDTEGDAGEEHYIVLDMGCDNTTLMVTNGYNVWIRNVPIGGNHFTRALTKEMKLSFAKAEHLKCNATKSPDPRAVFQALRPVFNDYVSEIQRSIGYFSSVNRTAKIEKVIGLGNGFKLAGLQKFLQQNLQYEVERPETFNALAGDAVLNSPMFAENILSFAVPYGLCLQSLGVSRIQTTLLPPEITQARMIRKKKPWAVATAATMLLGFSLATVGNAVSYQTVHTDDFAEAEKKANDFNSKVNSLKSSYDSEVGRYTATGERLTGLIDGRRDVQWLELYDAVIDCLPRDEGEEPEEIELRNQISLIEFSTDRVADVATWYAGLTGPQKSMIPADQRETGPSGEGYIVTLKGMHWHHDENDPVRGRSVNYIRHTLLKNLHLPTIQRPGFPERDVTRMGISHATIMDFSPTKKIIIEDTGAPPTENSRVLAGGNNRGGAGASRGYGSGSYGPSGYGGGGYGTTSPMPTTGPGGTTREGVKELEQTNFEIQFAWVPIPPEERTAEVVEVDEVIEDIPLEELESAPAATEEPAPTE
ncbi:Competence protein A [Thalassoglobus neptunius]|uniref:Competence protein A n=1 Tax=Thalassoglobus neptunius TaxID=1938619 RepID=A0A5C5X487_9PLAN|nr:type IV pilus assembly protein PilM [Thalassoglobus neptunius]TWT57548.1 Competence protein A [Thalassoglobus neptunius]